MVLCSGLCCKGHNIPPAARQRLYHGALGEPQWHHLRRFIREADKAPVKVHKDPSKNLTEVDYTASVFAKLFSNDAFRGSSAGLTLFGNGSAPIQLAPDPTMLQHHNIAEIR
jgi:hypothetical protein